MKWAYGSDAIRRPEHRRDASRFFLGVRRFLSYLNCLPKYNRNISTNTFSAGFQRFHKHNVMPLCIFWLGMHYVRRHCRLLSWMGYGTWETLVCRAPHGIFYFRNINQYWLIKFGHVELISPWTQRPPFRRLYIQMHFRKWQFAYFD